MTRQLPELQAASSKIATNLLTGRKTEIMTSTCIWVDATLASDFEHQQFSTIQSAAEGIADVFLVTNKSKKTLGSNHINISNSEIFGKENNHKKAESLIPGNADLKMLAFASRREVAKYENFVRLEYDCVFSREIRRSIEDLVDLATRYDVGYSNQFEKNADTSDWPWWSTLENSLEPSLAPPGRLYAAFLPLMIFNRKFLAAYLEYLRQGWRGHYEMLVPSIANWESMSILNFSQDSRFHIDNNAFTIHRPKLFDSPTSRLFHPVKTIAEFLKLPTRVARNHAAHGGLSPSLGLYSSESLSEVEFDFLKRKMQSAHRMLSFGGAGVVDTACAFELQKVNYVTSNKNSALGVLENERLRSSIDLGNLTVTLANIGRTDKLGYPMYPEEPEKWPRYMDCVEEGSKFDLIYVGGRFRVATCAEIYLRVKRDVDPDIILNDYTTRQFYSEIERILELKTSKGKLACFKFRAGKEDDARQLAHEFSNDPR